jgi:hypothetical protein
MRFCGKVQIDNQRDLYCFVYASYNFDVVASI